MIRSSLSFLAFGLVPAALAQAPIETHYGSSYSKLGYSVSRAGDYDSDGIVDLLVGLPQKGFANIFSGADGSTLWSVGMGGFFGRAVTSVGDLDGDGDEEFAVTSPYEQPGGVVYLYAGGTGTQIRKVKGPIADQAFGFSVCSAGDVDADGVPEIAVGAPANDGSGLDHGAVYVYSFAKNAMVNKFITLNVLEYAFGYAVANAGDIDLDGVDEIVVGAPRVSVLPGLASLISGKSGVVLSSFSAPNGSLSFGASVAGLGVIDSTGLPSVAIGAPSVVLPGSSQGFVGVYEAATGSLRIGLNGELNSRFGATVANAGDMNGDGFNDLAIGAPGEPGTLAGAIGKVHVYGAPIGTLLHTFSGPVANDRFGSAIAGLGSRDGDAYGELAIGAPQHDDTKGAVYVFGGLPPCASITKYGTGCFGSFGIVPELSLDGCALANFESPVTLSITQGPQVPTTALLFFGIGDGNIPLKLICSLHFAQLVGPAVLLPVTPVELPFGGGTLPGSGQISVSAMFPALGMPIDVRMQAILLDSGTPFGISATNAVRVITKQ